MTVKKGDFIEIDFVGRIKDSGIVFDLTRKEVAEKEKIANKSADYSPRTICVGNKDVVRGLDDSFIGKDVKKKYDVEIKGEDAFGKKNAKLIKMVPLNVFKKQNINPFPGLQVNIDGMFGIVRTSSGVRVLVYFNHPLAGKDISYEVEIKRIVNDDAEKVVGIINGLIGRKVKCGVKNGIAKVEMELPKEFQKVLEESILKLVKGLKAVEFEKAKAETKEKVTTKK